MVIPQTTAEYRLRYACSHVDQPLQPPVLWCKLSRYAGGNHISFLYMVFMFCWWCTATELASWRNQNIQGPLKHFYCQDCCNHRREQSGNVISICFKACSHISFRVFGDWGWRRVKIHHHLLVCCCYQWVSPECVSCCYLHWEGNNSRRISCKYTSN